MKLETKFLQKASVVDINQLQTATPHIKAREDILSRLDSSPFVSPQLFIAAARTIDPVFMLVVAVFIAAIYPGFSAITDLRIFAAISCVVALSLVVIFEAAGLYRLNVLLNPVRQLPVMFFCWAMMFAAVLGGVFITQMGGLVSRLWLTSFASSGFLFLIASKFVFASVLRRFNKNGQLNRRAVLVGGGEPAAKVISVLEESTDSGVNLVGIFDDRGIDRIDQVTHGLARLGDIDELIDFVRATRIDTLIVTLPVPAEERLLQILNRLWILPVDIRLSANGQKLHYRPRAYSYIGNLPCLDVFDKPLGEWGPFFKSIFDKTIAGLALVALFPVLLLTALAVKLDSKGPIIFKQKRFGFNNELIEVYKFRSMYTDRTDAEAAKLVTKGDPRVTKVGRFIRKSSLDELPQLFNVLKGNLSLVGPRPHPTKAKAGDTLYESVVDSYFARHKVKPGITGWAQINGWRGETDTAEKLERRVEHDLYYIDNWSLTFDLYILIRTPLALLNTDNAF
jgi:Undecaprenyl-phosphate glucose phosphotransferase